MKINDEVEEYLKTIDCEVFRNTPKYLIGKKDNNRFFSLIFMQNSGINLYPNISHNLFQEFPDLKHRWLAYISVCGINVISGKYACSRRAR
jgi:hypothetical protein